MKSINVETLGFKVLRELDETEKHKLGINIAEKLTSTFSYLKYDAIIERITNCSIYIAEIPSRYSRANYNYQNFSIYIAETVDINNPDVYFLHEIMHYLQDSRHYNGDLYKMGLCNFRTLKVSGLAINEAAIQYVISRITNESIEPMTCFGIDLYTYSKSYYPILSNILLQITNIFDESYLVKSLFRNDNSFPEAFCELCQNSISYKALLENMDIMLGCRDVIIDNSIKIKTGHFSPKELKTVNKINLKSIARIQESFFVIQNMLIKSYYKAMLRNIGYRMEADLFPVKVKELEKYLGNMNDNPKASKYKEYSEKYLKEWEDKYKRA